MDYFDSSELLDGIFLIQISSFSPVSFSNSLKRADSTDTSPSVRVYFAARDVTDQIKETLMAWAQRGALILIKAIIASPLLNYRL